MPNPSRSFVFVIPWFGTFAGGAERAIYDWARLLSDQGCDVRVFTTASQSPYKDWVLHQDPPGEYICNGIRTIKFRVSDENFEDWKSLAAKIDGGYRPTEDEQNYFFRYGIFSDDLAEAVRALPEQCNVIVGPYFQALAHQTLSTNPGRCILFSAFHDEAPFHWKPVSDMIENARSVLFLTDEEQDLALRQHPGAMAKIGGRGKLVQLPVNCSLATPPSKRHENYVLYIGRIERGKNLKELIEWHRKGYQGANNPPRLLVAGTGDVDLVDPQVATYVGLVSEEDKIRLIKSAVALVNPSLNESFSYVLMEAWAQAVPVIVHESCSVTSSHIYRARAGFAVGSAADYAAAVDFLSIQDNREDFGMSGFRYVTRNFNDDVAVESLFEAMVDDQNSY
ncbi:glycosyltransferase family 4 protein [Methylobacterium sp. C33D]